VRALPFTDAYAVVDERLLGDFRSFANILIADGMLRGFF
jgi:hypothetical protein